jgi:hypothetical protein
MRRAFLWAWLGGGSFFLLTCLLDFLGASASLKGVCIIAGATCMIVGTVLELRRWFGH